MSKKSPDLNATYCMPILLLSEWPRSQILNYNGPNVWKLELVKTKKSLCNPRVSLFQACPLSADQTWLRILPTSRWMGLHSRNTHESQQRNVRHSSLLNNFLEQLLNEHLLKVMFMGSVKLAQFRNIVSCIKVEAKSYILKNNCFTAIYSPAS